jgi:hypothetical protein
MHCRELRIGASPGDHRRVTPSHPDESTWSRCNAAAEQTRGSPGTTGRGMNRRSSVWHWWRATGRSISRTRSTSANARLHGHRFNVGRTSGALVPQAKTSHRDRNGRFTQLRMAYEPHCRDLYTCRSGRRPCTTPSEEKTDALEAQIPTPARAEEIAVAAEALVTSAGDRAATEFLIVGRFSVVRRTDYWR